MREIDEIAREFSGAVEPYACGAWIGQLKSLMFIDFEGSTCI